MIIISKSPFNFKVFYSFNLGPQFDQNLPWNFQQLKLKTAWLCFLLQVTNVSGNPEVLVNDRNDKVGGSRDYLDQSDYKKPLYLPG